MRVWAGAHAVDDFYQGLVPAAVPFFVLERDYSYVAASGLALAATVGSALPQLAVGIFADRHRAPWLAPLGVSVAGVGAGLAGLAPTYPMVFALLLLSGLGVAMFHPPAGRDARQAAGNSATAMSYFAVGGSVGFFLAPALVTPALDSFGLGATVLFIPPAVLTGYVLARRNRHHHSTTYIALPGREHDRPDLFAVLTCVEITRSAVSFGLHTFVALYWITHLGASPVLGGTALTLELAGGVIGTIAGGRIADRIGMVDTIRLGNILLTPAFLALLVCDNKYAALPVVFAVGAISGMPFAVLVKLGQDYLPGRPATAAGVTLGLAVSAGGLFMPALGLIADANSPRTAIMVLAAIPLLATAISTLLREPPPIAAT